MIQWAWSYLTYERGARLITGSDELPGWTETSLPAREGEAAEPEISSGRRRA
jgi:hypothetical protein